MTPASFAERARFQGLGWPNAREGLLLKVLTGSAAESRAAWSAWRKQGNLASMGTSSARLVPLVVRRLRQLGIEDPELPRLAGVVRHTWAANQVGLRAGLEAVEALTTAGIPVCALKGLPLLIDYFDADLSARPMCDLDVLVPKASVRLAASLLEAHGWSSALTNLGRGSWARVLQSQHALAFRRGAANVDLHWHVLHQDLSPFFDALAWQHAEPLARCAAPTPTLPPGLLALSPTEQLLHVCLHGLQHDARTLRLWALDALRILERRGKHVNWERLVATAVRRRLSVVLEGALGFLLTITPALPAEVVAALAREPVYPIELLEYRALTSDWACMRPEDREALHRMRNLRERSPWVTRELLAIVAA